MTTTLLRFARSPERLWAAVFALAACVSPQVRSPTPQASDALAEAAIEVPLVLEASGLRRVRVATGLANPRGMHALSDGSLLVAVAGTGDPASPSGGLLKLRDLNQDGDFDDEDERWTLLDKQPSRNLVEFLRRDEVFGMAAIAEGGGTLLTSLAYFGGPSTIFRIAGEQVAPWGSSHGNLNDLTYDLRRKAWVAVASTSDEVVQLVPGGRAERLVKIPPLARGQDAVPAYLRYDPRTGDLLVTLFSGSPIGEEGGRGVELVPRAGSIVRVRAETHQVQPVVTGLTLPTDLEIAADGSIYVLELCDAIVDPLARREDMWTGPSHGGFRRFSGRLIRIDRMRRSVTIVADALDAPTNLTRAGNALLIAQGMGTPRRLIPGPNGRPVPLTGFIERMELP